MVQGVRNDGENNNDEPLLVVAPFSLPGNYVLDFIVDGNVVRATIPPEGCSEGDIIELPPTSLIRSSSQMDLSSSSLSTSSIGSKTEKKSQGKEKNIGWSNRLCSVFNSCSQGLFLMALFFPYVVLGQLMQRMKLNICGVRDGGHCGKATCIYVFFFVLLVQIAAPSALLYFYFITENGKFTHFISCKFALV